MSGMRSRRIEKHRKEALIALSHEKRSEWFLPRASASLYVPNFTAKVTHINDALTTKRDSWPSEISRLVIT
jgi:hypothetical protein